MVGGWAGGRYGSVGLQFMTCEVVDIAMDICPDMKLLLVEAHNGFSIERRMSGKIESGEFAAASFASVDNGNLTNPSRTVNAKDCENYARSRSRQRWSAVPVRCAPCRQGSPSSRAKTRMASL